MSSDADRHKIHQLLGRYGIRILYTAYEIEVTGDSGILFARLADHIKSGDHLLAIPLCERCECSTHGDTIESRPRHGGVTQ